MNNPLQCVCVNIFNQLSDLIGNFNANAAQSSTFSHTSGFGDGVPQSAISGTGGAGTGDNGVFTFAVLLMVIALYFLSGRPQQQLANNKHPDDDHVGRRNFDTDFYDE